MADRRRPSRERVVVRARLQVDDEHGTAAVFMDLDLPDEQRRLLEPLLESLTAEDRLHLLADLIRAKADEEAYERICRDRGLLL